MIRPLLATILLLASPVWADAFDCAGAKSLSNPAASLAKVQEVYRAVQGLSAKFSQSSFLAALEVSETSSGDVFFAPPGKMKWHYKTPEEQLFTIADQSLWLYQPLDNQVVVEKLSNVLLSELPVAFLLGVGDLSRDFKIDSSCTGSKGFVFSLSPKMASTDDGLNSVKLLVDSKSFLPMGAKIIDVAQNETTILLSEINTSTQIQAKTFETKFPKGNDVDDRRVG